MKSKFFSIGANLSFEDNHKHQLAHIVQKLTLGMPQFEISMGGFHVATLKQNWSPLEKHFEVFYHYNMEPLIIRGDWFSYEYTFTRGNRIVATVSRRIFSITDAYGAEIAPGEDVAFILSIIVAIDKALHDHVIANPGFVAGPSFVQPNTTVVVGGGPVMGGPIIGGPMIGGGIVFEERFGHHHHHHHHHHRW